MEKDITTIMNEIYAAIEKEMDNCLFDYNVESVNNDTGEAIVSWQPTKSIEHFVINFEYQYPPEKKPDYSSITRDIIGR